MRHLYLRIYVAIVLILLVFGLLVSAAFWLSRDADNNQGVLVLIAALVENTVPSGQAPEDALLALTDLSARTGVDFTLRDAHHAVIATTSEAIALPDGKKRHGLVRFDVTTHPFQPSFERTVALRRLEQGALLST